MLIFALTLYACLTTLAVVILVGGVKHMERGRAMASKVHKQDLDAKSKLETENAALQGEIRIVYSMMQQQDLWIAANMKHAMN